MFDVPALIERSMPKPRATILRWLIGGVLGGLLFALLSFGGTPREQIVSKILLGLMLLIWLITTFAVASSFVRAQRAEAERVGAIEQFVTLRQWTSAAVALHGLLLQPMLSHASRIQALIFLSSVLGRYHKFHDAVEVHEYLLKHVELDPKLMFTIRLGRAMMMLRDDRLVDADRAISEIRRMPGASETAAAALVELYRDVKTGHTTEAIEIFESKRDRFGPELAHRAADAHLLAAAAYLARGDEPQAAECFNNATLLAPPVELLRRYPELQHLFDKFQPAPAPPEAA